jgi:hypothetical protein
MAHHERPACAGAAVCEAAGLAELDLVVAGHAATVRQRAQGRVACGAMDARSLARLHALGRLGVGAGMTLAPGLVAGGWVGAVADKPEGQVLAIGLGGRDAAIAIGTLRALGAGYGARSWMRAGMLADAADLLATLKARDRIPALAVPAVVAIAGGSVLLGAWLQAVVD